jgi:hypothetical protein
LLDTYDLERRPASARATEVSLTNFSRLAESRDLVLSTPRSKPDLVVRAPIPIGWAVSLHRN